MITHQRGTLLPRGNDGTRPYDAVQVIGRNFMSATVTLPPIPDLAALCRRWHITELALFGSVLRDDFGPESDIDLLVTFAPDARWGLFALADITEEFQQALHRDVDLVERRAVERSENWARRQHILGTARVIYASG